MGKELVLDEAITAEAENRVLSMKADTTTASKATLSVMSAKRLSPMLTASQKFDPVVPLLSLLNEARVWKLPTVKKISAPQPHLAVPTCPLYCIRSEVLNLWRGCGSYRQRFGAPTEGKASRHRGLRIRTRFRFPLLWCPVVA